MEQERVIFEITKLNDEIRDLKDQIELLQVKKRHIQNQCKHPKGHSYKDYSGQSSFYCPDCGYDR